MAYMVNMAQDWSYDMFVEDSKLYFAKPIKGVHCSSDADIREKFMTWLKNAARDFKAEWLEQHNNHLYDNYEGYIGDAFGREVLYGFGSIFSDYYKDAYGQRPHLDTWFYVKMLGLPHSEDVFRTFCARPVEDAVSYAKEVRRYFEEEAC